MSFAPVEPSDARILRAPEGDTAGADEAVELARACGMGMLAWQEYALRLMLTEQVGDHRWAANEFGLVVPRQNGKTHLLAARVLAGLFIFDEPLITYTAHEFKTTYELFRLVAHVCRNNPELKRRVARNRHGGLSIRFGNGHQEIELASGARFKVLARTRSSGRGFAGSTVILDEALELRDDNAMSALVPTMSAQDNPQLIYSSSAGDPASVVLAAARRRAIDGDNTRLGWLEYAASATADIADPDAWASANPALGALIRADAIELELGAMTEEKFKKERLGIWAIDAVHAVIPASTWDTAREPAPNPVGAAMSLAFEVAPDRDYGAIMAAWPREDGRTHVRVSRYAAGDGWLVGELAELHRVFGVPVTCNDSVPGRDIIDALERDGVEVVRVNRRDYAAACAAFLSAVFNGGLTHHGDYPLDAAVQGAGTQAMGEAWVWRRYDTDTDISPLQAATLACWGLTHAPEPPQPMARPEVF